MPFLSVIIPVYNSEKFISRCLDSILEQKINMEIIPVDDGSTDLSGTVIDKYSKRFSFIRPIYTMHVGQMNARLTGVQCAQGQFITFVDSDDWIEVDMYEKLMEPLLTNEQVDISIGGYMLVYPNGEKKALFHGDEKVVPSYLALRYMFEQKNFSCSLCDKIYRKSLFDNWAPAWVQSSYGEDTEWNWKLFRRARKISYRPLMKYNYFIHDESYTHKLFSEDQLAYMYRWGIIWKATNDYLIRKSIAMPMITFGIENICNMVMQKESFWKVHIINFQNILSEILRNFSIDYDETLKKKCEFVLNDYNILKRNLEYQYNKMMEVCNKVCSKYTNIYIYGAGTIAREITLFFRREAIPFDGFIVTDVKNENRFYLGKPVYDFPVWIINNNSFGSVLVLAVNKKNEDEIIKTLNSYNLDYVSLGRYSINY